MSWNCCLDNWKFHQLMLVLVSKLFLCCACDKVFFTELTGLQDANVATHIGFFFKVISLYHFVSYRIIEYRCVSIFTESNHEVPTK
jgi:hypothetical protein